MTTHAEHVSTPLNHQGMTIVEIPVCDTPEACCDTDEHGDCIVCSHPDFSHDY